MTKKRHELDAADGISAARRQFLRRTGRAGLLALGAPALAANWAAEAYGAAARSYIGGRYGLELDGAFAGLLTGFSGGNATGDVIKEKSNQDFVQRKHLGSVRVEPVTIETQLPMPRSFYDWIKSSIEPRPRFLRKNGAIVEFDMSNREVGRRNFFNALITEVEFPSCDGSSKDQARLAVTFSPETVRLGPSKGAPLPLQSRQMAHLLRSNFRLRIQGLEQATVRTSKIESIEVKVATAETGAGKAGVYSAQPGAIEVPNLVITVADSSAAPFYAWHEDFVLKGNNGQDRERPGVLEYLSADLKTVLLALNFFNLGIYKVAPDTPSGPQDTLRRSKVEMYCEAVTADFRI
jgi:hypothetical protein